MANANEGDRERRVASGFPDPDQVPGPTERLRELHGDTETAPKPPKYGRASASTAASDDYISIDDMLSASGGTIAGGAADRLAAFARKIGDETADRLRGELDRRGVAEKARAAGLGVGQMGVASALGLGALGAASHGDDRRDESRDAGLGVCADHGRCARRSRRNPCRRWTSPRQRQCRRRDGSARPALTPV